MKKNILFFMACLFMPAHAYAMVVVPIANTNEDTGPGFTYSLSNSKAQFSNTFMSNEAINLRFSIKVQNDHVSQFGHLYLLALYHERWYQKMPSGQWQLWDRQLDSLSPYLSKTLNNQENITVLRDETLPVGEFLVYAGYQVGQSGSIFYNKTVAALLVFDQQSATLHQVKNSALLANYLAHGVASNNFGIPENDFSSPTQSDTVSASGSATKVSQTNLQEKGVDEADRIKTDGEQLYVLENCDKESARQCISSYDIQAEPASNNLLQKLDVETNTSYLAGIYLAQINDKKHLVYQGNSSNYGIYDIWYSPYYWQNTQADLKIIDVSQPQKMQVSTHISLDTSILSSRLIDGVLYLITRKNAYYTYPEVLLAPTVDDGVSEPIVSPTVPEKQTLNDLLPTISFNDGTDDMQVVSATDCFIPNQVSGKPVDNTIITITAIPLDNPKGHYSRCIIGAVDTFYMSTKALYFASSRYPYTVESNQIRFAPDNSTMATEIHKFLFSEGALDYRGSGTVPGHLGWDANKQPFRMGEYQGILKVATSQGNTWDNSSKTRVSVMREASGSQRIEEIAFVDNLGKPGEQLFAARFIRNHGYLVTFRQTDPLYVLDFSVPEQPVTVGELEINGYSDYLHPVGEHYLLGIGKDAIPSENPNIGGLYQGVKLSLFDVSSAENLGEISSLILGKRGTESAILTDHHALAWLPSTQGDSATLAIPVQLHQEMNNINQDYSHPSAYYGWAHTGLYAFNINTGSNPGIELAGKLISDISSEQCNQQGNFCSFQGQNVHNDRAVVQEGSLHYIHNNSVISSAIADLE